MKLATPPLQRGVRRPWKKGFCLDTMDRRHRRVVNLLAQVHWRYFTFA